MKSRRDEFAHYCCELLSTVGPCDLRRMFGGYGISTDGLCVNEKLNSLGNQAF